MTMQGKVQHKSKEILMKHHWLYRVSCGYEGSSGGSFWTTYCQTKAQSFEVAGRFMVMLARSVNRFNHSDDFEIGIVELPRGTREPKRFNITVCFRKT
jgi:hypothetical protein